MVMDAQRGTRVAAVPDLLDRLGRLDRDDAHRLHTEAEVLDRLAARLRVGCPGAGLQPAAGARLDPLVAGLEREATFVVSVAAAFRRADLQAFVTAAATAVPARLRRGGRTYLRADDRGDGRMVEVLGDLSQAQHVVFLVPGMTNQRSNYETQLRSKAVALFEEASRQAPRGERVAVIAWLGYNTPDGDPSGLVDAALSISARDGARQLRRDLDALRQHGMRAHVTVVGHSYGSIVAGHAMSDGAPLPVDEVIVVGSPGMDAANRAALGSPRVRVWAGRNGGGPRPLWARVLPSLRIGPVGPGGLWTPVIPVVPVLRRADPVPFAPVHGPDPTRPEFGARRLPVSGHGHGDYFRPGTRSLRAIARVVVGSPP